MTDIVAAQHLQGRALGIGDPVSHHVEVVTVVGSQAQVVDHHKGRLAGILQIVHDEELVADVQVVCRFIQDEHIRPLCYRPGDEDHLPLTAGKPLDASIRKALNAQLPQGSSHDLLLVLPVFLFAGIEAHGHHVGDGKVESTGGVLADVADHGGQISRAVLPNGSPVDTDAAFMIRDDAEGGFDEGGLTAAVGPHDAHDLVLMGAEGGVGENILASQFHSNVFIFDGHFFLLPPYPFLIIRNMKNGAPMKAVTMPRGSSAAPCTLRA